MVDTPHNLSLLMLFHLALKMYSCGLSLIFLIIDVVVFSVSGCLVYETNTYWKSLWFQCFVKVGKLSITGQRTSGFSVK